MGKQIKLALGIIAFNGMPFLEGVLETWYPHVDQIIVAEGPVKFWRDQGSLESTDGTIEMLRDFPDPYNRLRVLYGYSYLGGWADKLEMANAWMDHVEDDVTHVICMDADEFMLEEDIELIINALWNGIDSVGLRLYSFVGGFDRYMTGFEEKLEVIRVQGFYPGAKFITHRPPAIIDPSTSRGWKHSGNHLDYDTLDAQGIRLYHYSHVLRSQVEMKQRYYTNLVGAKNVIPDYYERVWKPWVVTDEKQVIENLWNGIHDFHPRYRGDCFSQEFTGEHPWWIRINAERILEMRDEQIEKGTS